ncbi:MAG TPA: 2OG-Fe(II) oxygenase [Pseudolabrys sp.]|nr:2OG-Fe(II) oxygenase [Pseudolabrys sp.]
MESAAPPVASNELLLKRIADPKTLRHWLATVEDRLKKSPSDRELCLRYANLLRALGELTRARVAFAALPTLPTPDLVRERALAILSGEILDWTDAAGPVPFVRLNDFLSEERQAQLWDIVSRSPDFRAARVSNDAAAPGRADPAIRQAHIVRGASRIRDWFLPLIESAIDRERVLPRLGLAPFAVGDRELQITGHGDGGFFHMHKDSGHKRPERYLTYVYYFHRQPARFSGGELFLYDHDSNGRSSGAIAFTRLAPAHNSVVLFPSDRWHAVGDVTMNSSDPLDGRWTVNGWLHRRLDAEPQAQPSA